MRSQILILILLGISSLSHAQVTEIIQEPEKKTAITLGLLQGGGSLVGADLEFLLVDKLGIQVGAGLVGFGAGLNYHFKPSIRSSFLSFQYWNQGIGEGFVQSLAGPNFVYRGKKWFTFQVGLGKTLKKGPAFPTGKEMPPVMMMYSIGGYIPF